MRKRRFLQRACRFLEKRIRMLDGKYCALEITVAFLGVPWLRALQTC
jgi:hypothetical protein